MTIWARDQHQTRRNEYVVLGFEKPFHKNDEDIWFTRRGCYADMSEFSGHYRMNKDEAVQDYLERLRS